ncbi:hypothetical protein UYO_1045 [Lachnospiraceae bacterium JC7]|nr:hypothetical protein UYO_1045 [Lachnospiraceae bacterium JC7]
MGDVKLWEEDVIIPTYGVGEPDKNPMFMEKRVYQGSSGRIYPYPTIEKIYDEKKDKHYKAVFLENDYLKIMILPELGGRIQRAYDKTNGYDFVYYNQVIKPALVGLLGPWISGGIEFNWPQHHRPTTFMPVDHILVENPDGSKTCRISDMDQMYGTRGEASFTLYPGKAYLEIKGQLYNRTSTPQTFLWWANPAVPVNDHTQSVFPPDVHAVMDHGKRDVSRFPIATGVYYKHDYSAGVDISRYKNIPVPTSYMAEKSDFDFVGGYDYKVGAGLLHVADHHVSPGKKQWTWGCGDFGRAWDRNLTDEDGPYIELMCGVFTDNQPDFSWLKPMEEKTFTQYFMPYKAVGQIKNATKEAAVNMELKDGEISLIAYGTADYPDARFLLTYDGEVLSEETAHLSPVSTYSKTIRHNVSDETKLCFAVFAEGRELVHYSPLKKEIPELPHPAEAAKAPSEIMTNEELYLTGLHIEQYRHATFRPDDYYLEGLKRDPGDIRINNAFGSLLMRRGLFKEAEEHFRRAIRRLTWKNPNPYDSEAYYDLGLVLLYQNRDDEAFEAFYKASWSAEQQEMSFYYLAAIEAKRGHFTDALKLSEKALVKNAHNVKACGLRLYLMRKLGMRDEALAVVKENLRIDPFDYVTRMEESYLYETDSAMDAASRKELSDEKRRELIRIARNYHENFLTVARDYVEFGAYKEASDVLGLCTEKWAMLEYEKAYIASCEGKEEEAKALYKKAAEASTDYVFPNKLEDILVLNDALRYDPEDGNAWYYLGDLYYDKTVYDKAIEAWENASERRPEFATIWRNLSIAYFNKRNDVERSKAAMEKAYALAPKDPRIFLEHDQLLKKLNVSHGDRLKLYEENPEVFSQRDDLKVEYVTLLNLLGDFEKAISFIRENRFHPWEGGEGKITTQYVYALTGMALKEMKKGHWPEAKALLEEALVYPENLGEGKLEGTKDNNINYYIGICEEHSGEGDARGHFTEATIGTDEPAGMMYYNDQPADMIYFEGLALEKLGKEVAGKAHFNKLIDYGERHMRDEVRIGYFAVSLPDFQIFDEDWTKRNRAHCHYLIGLGKLGYGDAYEAAEEFRKAIELEPTHWNAIRYLQIAEKEL